MKNRNEKRIDMRIARAIKPNRVFELIFLRKRKEACSATDPNRVIRGLFAQKEDHLEKKYIVCAAPQTFLRISAGRNVIALRCDQA